MALADIRQRPGFILAGAIALHIVLISLQVTTGSGATVFHAATFGAFAEAQRAATGVAGGVRDTWQGYVDLRQVRTENEALRAQLGSMLVRLQVERARAERADAYRDLLQFRARVPLTTTGAEVIGGSASPEFRTVTIDKGTGDGLAPDMPVVAPAGIVGRVTRPGGRAALVQLIIDRNAAAGAIIERTRVQGIVVGLGDGMLRMDFVAATGDVVAGDVVVTSGIDGLYPRGFAIGTVETVGRGDGVYHQIAVRPSVDFFRLEDVLVVVSPLPSLTEGRRP